MAEHPVGNVRTATHPGVAPTVEINRVLRNTYLLRITNNEPSELPVEYDIAIDGLDRAEVTAVPVRLAPEQTVTLPLIVRLPREAANRRTVPFTVRVASPTAELLLPTTFKTGADVGRASP